MAGVPSIPEAALISHCLYSSILNKLPCSNKQILGSTVEPVLSGHPWGMAE